MDWAKQGIKIVHSDQLDLNTPQTSGMTRAAAITHARAGASKLWAGTMLVQPDAKTGPHHHGELETVLYVVKGRNHQIAQKTVRLVRRFNALFPEVRIETAFGWAGVFGSTKDGLAYIGRHPSFPRAYFALGFGGNGITFSEIASRILADLFLGRENQDAKVFHFDR